MNGLRHGSGIWKGNKGDSYIGEWKLGKADGMGVHIWVNGFFFKVIRRYFYSFFYKIGDRYEGQFKEFLKWGHG